MRRLFSTHTPTDLKERNLSAPFSPPYYGATYFHSKLIAPIQLGMALVGVVTGLLSLAQSPYHGAMNFSVDVYYGILTSFATVSLVRAVQVDSPIRLTLG